MRFVLGALVVFSAVVCAQVPMEPDAQLKLVAADFKFTEGPAVDRNGDVYFTDQPNDQILKWTAADNTVETFLKPSGRANGLAMDRQGNLIACADEKGQLLQIDVRTKQVTVLLDHFAGKLFNGPNDAWVDPAGGIYFTDPFYKRNYWQDREVPEQEKQRLFYLPKGATVPLIADDTLVQPNGIIGSADGKLLFVADIGAKKTYRYDVAADGGLTGRKLFCEMGSDGMTLDSAGNLYLTGKGVTVFDREGKKLGDIPVPEGWTANVTFGGPKMNLLFITAMDSVYTLEMAVKGVQ